MIRYFFNVHDGTTSLDEEGSLFHSLDDAKTAAAGMLGMMIRDNPARFRRDRQWRVEVTNEQQTVLFALHFSLVDLPAVVGPSPQALY
jgi:hypothetical protein